MKSINQKKSDYPSENIPCKFRRYWFPHKKIRRTYLPWHHFFFSFWDQGSFCLSVYLFFSLFTNFRPYLWKTVEVWIYLPTFLTSLRMATRARETMLTPYGHKTQKERIVFLLKDTLDDDERFCFVHFPLDNNPPHPAWRTPEDSPGQK